MIDDEPHSQDRLSIEHPPLMSGSSYEMDEFGDIIPSSNDQIRTPNTGPLHPPSDAIRPEMILMPEEPISAYEMTDEELRYTLSEIVLERDFEVLVSGPRPL